MQGLFADGVVSPKLNPAILRGRSALTTNQGGPISTETRVNERIRVPEVRLIGPGGEQVGIVRIEDALRVAADADLDLVEVAPDARPPVCKIMDYGKYLYQKDKAAHAAKKKQKQIQVKEIKFRPSTEDGDFQTKLRQIKGFFEEGDKVKIVVRFRGREMAHQELGMQVIERLKGELNEIAVIEQYPRMEGRQSVMVMSPKKK